MSNRDENRNCQHVTSLKTDLRFAALKFAGGDGEAKRRSEEKPVKTVCNPIAQRSEKLIG